MVVKTFRGLLADGGQDRIRLSTIKGKVGYRIIKFEVFPNFPGTQDYESTLQIWKTSQSSISTSTATVNFTDSDLLAAAYYVEDKSATYGNPPGSIIIFDQETVNQDIYITHTATTGSEFMNYYFELEVIPLDDAGAEYTTLKDMRTG